jgi:hypothetical protein
VFELSMVKRLQDEAGRIGRLNARAGRKVGMYGDRIAEPLDRGPQIMGDDAFVFNDQDAPQAHRLTAFSMSGDRATPGESRKV